MNIYRLGIIGYGGFGRFLHHAWSSLDRVEVCAVADAHAASDPGTVRFYADWQALLGDPDVDLVSIATPPALHAEMACAAMEAGKHVLIEKPLALSLADAQRVCRVQEQTGHLATVDYMLRFNPIVETLHAWCRSGAFGPLRRVWVENYAQDDALPPAHWFWDRKRSGGILVEHAVHFIDLIDACTSALPQRVEGVALCRNPQQEDRVLATVVYGDGLLATHYHAFSRPGFFERTSMRFVFDLAQVEVDGWIPLSGRVTALTNDATQATLEQLSGLQVTQRMPVAQVGDPSPPEGWGEGHEAALKLFSSGIAYEVEAMVEGTFALRASKSEVYAASLRALLADLIAAIDDPAHRLRVSLDDGWRSLATALKAAQQARRACPHEADEGEKWSDLLTKS